MPERSRKERSLFAATVPVVTGDIPKELPHLALWQGDVEAFLKEAQHLGLEFDLVVTSPPYNLGKAYESRLDRDEYISWQQRVIQGMAGLVSEKGSICWQVGNYVENGTIVPLDILLHPIDLSPKNRSSLKVRESGPAFE